MILLLRQPVGLRELKSFFYLFFADHHRQFSGGYGILLFVRLPACYTEAMSTLTQIIASCAYLGASIFLIIFAINLQSLYLYLGVICLAVGVILNRFFSNSSSSSLIDKMEEAAKTAPASDPDKSASDSKNK